MSQPITCAILTVSDTCSNGEKIDTSGPSLKNAFQKVFPNSHITTSLVPDNFLEITTILNRWILSQTNIILTTGGTGFSPRDITPEATKSVIDREAPGITNGILVKSLEVTGMAMLSRAVAGIKDKTLIVNLPGSAKGALECFGFIQDIIPHAIALIIDDSKAIEKQHKKLSKTVRFIDDCAPSAVLTNNIAERPRSSPFPMVEMPNAFDIINQESTLSFAMETIPIEDSLHRVLAEDVLAYSDVPAFDASIKDGYAVLASDGAAPRRVKSALGAGDWGSVKLESGEAIRINTGAPIPEGADAVIPVEDTVLLQKEGGEEVEIGVTVGPVKGQDIRKKGCDVARGSVVLEKGGRLQGAHVGVLAAVGKSLISVYKRSSVGIFTTGNELREHFEELRPGQIYDSNRLALINLLKEYHYDCDDYGIVCDEPDAIKMAIATALTINDVLITTGGVSMGEFDFIKRVLVEDFGAKIHFGRVNMKPGKPTTFATLEFEGAKKIVFGLPGNPVSACVTCLLFIIPMLRQLEGSNQWLFPTIPYVVSVSDRSSDPRPEYVRSIVGYVDGKIVAKPNGGQISSRLNSLVGANGLLLMPGSMVPGKEYLSHIILIGDLLAM